MVRADAPKNKANKNVEPVAVKRRGAKCHFVGEQWDFLAAEASQFRLAKDNGTQGKFYKMVGRGFVRKWVPKFSSDGEDEDEDDPATAAVDNTQIADTNNDIDPTLRGTTSEAVANESSDEFNVFAKVNTLS